MLIIKMNLNFNINRFIMKIKTNINRVIKANKVNKANTANRKIILETLRKKIYKIWLKVLQIIRVVASTNKTIARLLKKIKKDNINLCNLNCKNILHIKVNISKINNKHKAEHPSNHSSIFIFNNNNRIHKIK